MSKLVKMVVEKGYHYFDWNIESHDDEKDKTSKDIYNSVINGLSKDKINVVLMHDYEENYRVIDALRDIIDSTEFISLELTNNEWARFIYGG